MNGYRSRSSGGQLTLGLNKRRYRQLVAAKGWATQTQQANGLGLSQATVSRLLESDARPGPNAIAALLTAFPGETFDSLFSIVAETPMRRSA